VCYLSDRELIDECRAEKEREYWDAIDDEVQEMRDEREESTDEQIHRALSKITDALVTGDCTLAAEFLGMCVAASDIGDSLDDAAYDFMTAHRELLHED